MHRRAFIQSVLAAGLLPHLPNYAATNNHAAIAEFIEQMHRQHGLPRQHLQQTLGQLQANKKVLKLTGVSPQPAKKVYWNEYRQKRLTPNYIAQGVNFYQQHQPALQQAESTFGVEQFIIAAIIGVETRYGAYTGNFSVLESLFTLAFFHPTRAAEFRPQLEQFLIYTHQHRLNPSSINGSFAGAFGIPQFLPESLIRHAVDFDDNGTIDLFSFTDAIGSVGNFLKNHGWLPRTAISYPVTVAEQTAQTLIAENKQAAFKPIYKIADLQARGVTINATNYHTNIDYLFVDLENKLNNEYRIGTPNFYALTRYNRSFKYAAAVTDLSRAIKKQL